MRYSAGLTGVSSITLPYETPGYRHVFHLYVIETKNPAHRDPLLELPQPGRRGCQVPLPHRHPSAGRLPRGASRPASPVPIPNAERNAASCVSLPMFPELTAEEVDYTIAKVVEWTSKAK